MGGKSASNSLYIIGNPRFNRLYLLMMSTTGMAGLFNACMLRTTLLFGWVLPRHLPEEKFEREDRFMMSYALNELHSMQRRFPCFPPRCC